MRGQRFFKRFPTAQSLKSNRFLKPLARHLHYHFLWQLNRRAVTRGAAVGLFFGILLPFAQIFLAAIAAILFRANLPVAVFSTLVSNPLTFPPIYYAAYLLGDILTGATPIPTDAKINDDIEQAVAMQQGEAQSWLTQLIDWVQSVGLPLGLGLVVLATAAALTGYFLVSALWKWRIRWRWRQRQSRRSSAGVTPR